MQSYLLNRTIKNILFKVMDFTLSIHIYKKINNELHKGHQKELQGFAL